MSETLVFIFMAVSLIPYAITGGADFGVGILEFFSPRKERPRIRELGDRAIAPIWEANHIWLIIALVILFIAFPTLHVRITTYLHVPLLIMLTGIILRGTAFTFRYYDLDSDHQTQVLWSFLFRGGSILVPMAFGHLVASLSRGDLPPQPTTVWESYWAPWLGLFPLAAGIFTTVLFAWIACVFLLGEVDSREMNLWQQRAKLWTFLAVAAGFLVALCGYVDGVPWLTRISQTPLALGSVFLASILTVLLWRQLHLGNAWLIRILGGTLVTLILTGYWGAHFPNIIELSDGTSLTWQEHLAPEATLSALTSALVAGSLLILPGLFYLFKLFKQPRAKDS